MHYGAADKIKQKQNNENKKKTLKTITMITKQMCEIHHNKIKRNKLNEKKTIQSVEEICK